MDKQKLNDWQHTADEAGFQPIAAPELDGLLGDTFAEENTGRIWQRLLIKHGTGQWVYSIDVDEYTACADSIFNGDASHFVGYLPRSHPGSMAVASWVLIEPKFRPKIRRLPNIEDLERGEGRYERNDVDRIQKGPQERNDR